MNLPQGTILQSAILKYKQAFIFAGMFSFVINMLTLAMPIYSLQVLDRVVSSGSLETLLMLTIIVVGILIFLGIMGLIRSFVFFQIAAHIDRDVSQSLVGDALSLSCREKDIQPSQIARDFNVIKNFFSGQIIHTLFDAPWAVIFIIATFLVHYITGIVVLVAALVLVGIAYLNERFTKQQVEETNEASIRSLHHIEIASRNAEVIEAMGMKNNILSHWNTIQHHCNTLQARVNEKATLFSSLTKTIRLCIQIGMMGIGGYLVLKHEMTGGGIIAASILAGKALAPFDTGVATWKSIITTRKSYTRLQEFCAKVSQRERCTLLPEPTGRVTVEKVFFSPNPTIKPIIKGVSFSVVAGESIGIIGPSGAGKTTLGKLLVGIYKPTSGVVRLDGAELYAWDKTHVGKYIGYLPHDIALFKGTVKMNIARMHETFDDAEVMRVAQLLHIHDMILRLPKGYETEIGMGGAYLSAGQAQQIGLARVLYGNPKLIVLDEPNAHLDTQGEQAFIQAMQTVKQNKITACIIAHKPSVVACVDKIVVINDGAVALFDTRENVLAQLSGKVLQRVHA